MTRTALREWWHASGGYREVLQLAWPLILSQGANTILQMVDRMFLTWHSPEALAASGPSGALAFTIQSVFVGLAGYAAVFVAQYTGADKPRQAVAVIWQALYLSVLAALLILLIAPVGASIFRLAGHDPAIQHLEVTYYDIFLYGSFTFIGSAAVTAYFIGRGITRVLLWINLVSITCNGVLDYLLIFGIGPFPEMGIAGAAWASVIAQSVALLIAFGIFLRDAREMHAEGGWKLDVPLMGRLLRFGYANGVQIMLDMIGWTGFMLLLGRLGATALAATNLAFQLNCIAFLPIMGLAMATSTLVGQSLGRDDPQAANHATWSAIHIGLLFTAAIGALYVLIPDVLIAPFAVKADPVAFAAVREQVVVMLRFVAAYCLFDVCNLAFAGALKGAGDTLFVMLLSSGLGVTIMLVPTYLWCVRPGGLGVYGAWFFITLFVCVLAVAFLLRYLHGKWRTMRVIEQEVI
ncbi:MAG: Multidrug resistance protein NorM [bacterium ADurb.Bin429]|nr:MAG: Multidrug resistance protein NorM [bacterium ADurb.Bin429]